MKMHSLVARSLVFASVAVVLCAAAAGCGSSGRTKQAYSFHPVKGRVTLNEQPLTQGTIQFSNPDDSNFVASSPIAADGSFNLTTTTIFSSSKNQGVPIGKYRVMINLPSDGKSAPPPLSADGMYEIKAGPNEITVDIR